MNPFVLKKVLITGITLLLAAGWTRADSHFVMVKVTRDIHSVFVIGTAGNSPITATPKAVFIHFSGFHQIQTAGYQLVTQCSTEPSCMSSLSLPQTALLAIPSAKS